MLLTICLISGQSLSAYGANFEAAETIGTVPVAENPATEPPIESTTEPTMEPATESTAAPSEEPATEPSMEPPTEPITEPTVSPETQPPAEETTFPTVLQIDSKHIFPGMDSSYEQGYNPRIENDEAVMIVPLVSTGKIQNDEVFASVDVGQGNVPFVVASYEKVIPLTAVTTADGAETVELYLAEFRIPLKTSRQNGTYPVKLSFSGYAQDAQAVKLDYTVFVTVTDEEIVIPEPTVPPKAPAVYGPPKPTAEPIVYISESILEPGTAVAGEEFVLTLALKNSVTTKDVKNMLVTVDLDNLQINLLEKSTVIPVDTLKAGQEVKLPLHFSTDPNIKEGKHNLKFHFSYDSSQTLKLSSEGSVIVNVRQPAELSYDGASLPVKVFQGDTVAVSVNLMNTGKSPLYNCRIDFDMEGLQSGGTVFVGEIPAGENKVGRGNLRVSKEVLGDVKGEIIISYEDAFGKDFQKKVKAATLIAPKPEEPEAEEKQQPSYWWAFILTGIAIGGLAGFGIPWLIRDRKQRKEDDLRL